MPCRLVFGGADKDLKKHLEDCNMMVVARLSTCIRKYEQCEEPLVNVDNSTSSTVCMPANVTIKEEEASPPRKHIRLNYDDGKSVTQKVGSTCSNVITWIKIDRIALTLTDISYMTSISNLDSA